MLFTNYQRYVNEFVAYGTAQMREGGEYEAFVRAGQCDHSQPTPSDQAGQRHAAGAICRRCPPIT